MQNLKGRLARALAKKEWKEVEESGEWADHLAKVTKQYNKTDHSAVHGEPEDVKTDPVQNFLVLQDNASKLAHNRKLHRKRVGLLRGKGAFRAPKKGLGTFARGYRAKYGPVEEVELIAGSNVKGSGGTEIDIKRALPVNKESGNVEPRFALQDSQDEAKRTKTKDLMEKLYMWLADGEQRSLSAAATMLKEIMGADYEAILASVGASSRGGLAKVIRMWEDAFILTAAPTGKDNYYIQVRGG